MLGAETPYQASTGHKGAVVRFEVASQSTGQKQKGKEGQRAENERVASRTTLEADDLDIKTLLWCGNGGV